MGVTDDKAKYEAIQDECRWQIDHAKLANEKEEYLPFLPLMLLAAFYSNLKEFENRKQADEEMRRNCPSIEWEQDMGAHVPFCKIYGGMCNMQCLQK